MNASSTATKIGPAIVLKVMAGDQFNARVTSWYSSTTHTFSNVSALSELVNAKASGMGRFQHPRLTLLNQQQVLASSTGH